MPHDWFRRSDKDNYEINYTFAKKHSVSNNYNASKHLVCFSHVPKTGGTSLESILAKNFALAETLHINAPDLNKQVDLLCLKKNHPKLICGHHPMHALLYQVLPNQPIFHLTQLREPIDRVLSYYNYVRGKTNHPMHHHAAGKSITQFLHANPSPELANGQAKRFSGYLHQGSVAEPELFKIAQNTLKNCFSMVLTTCLFDEGLLLLKKRLSLKDIFYTKHNVSNRYVSREDLTLQDMDMIKSVNQADLDLYDWAKKQCEMMISKDLSPDDTTQFKLKNQQWADLINA